MREISDNQAKLGDLLKGQDKYPWFKIGMFFCFLALFIILKSVLNGTFGVIGSDNDDALRLVQIKDYLSGQSWFDTNQYRMGPGLGTDMHWSRLPDIPIIALTHIFDIFLPQDKALSWAYSVWPPLTSVFLIFGVMIGLKNYDGAKINIFALILLTLFITNFYRYLPGSIDHHNLQIGLMVLSAGLILDSKVQFKSYFLAGLSVATAIAIGVEVYIFAAIICAYVAISWAFYGHSIRRRTIGFGMGLFLGLLSAFLLTIPSSEYGLIYCDALSSVTLLAGAIGGLGLASLTFIAPKFSIFKSLPSRFLGLVFLGLLCGLILLLYAPQCLSNPLDSLPQDVKILWLSNVTEAKPLFKFETDKWIEIPMALGAPCVALLVLCLRIKNRLHEQDIDKTHLDKTIFQFVLLLSALLLTVYQIRYFMFAYVFSLIALSSWTAKTYYESKKRNPASILYLVCIILSVQLTWVLPGSLFKIVKTTDAQKTVVPKVESCMSDSVIDVMSSLPQGLVSATANMTTPILLDTKHRALGGNYHRNWEGIQAQIHISISEPEIARQILAQSGVDYLHYCPGGSETRIYSKHNSKGLFAEIGRGNVPDFLKPISVPTTYEDGVQIFKFVKQDGQ